MRHVFLVILFSLSLITTEAQETQSIPAKNKTVNAESKENYLAVISVRITRSENQYSVKLTNGTILNTVKNISAYPKTWHENDVVCFILDEQKQVLDTLVIQQPLKARYEFPHDDKKTIETTTMNLTEKDVVLRFDYSVKMKFLSVAKVGENKKLEKLNILALPQIK